MYETNTKLRKISNLIYATIKTLHGEEKYPQILTRKKSIQIMAKFRISNHELEIEQGSHKGILMAKRCCFVCEQHGKTVLEDEFHLLLHCSLCDEIRNRYLQTCLNGKQKNFGLFIEIMTEENENYIINLAAYLNECFKKRKIYIELLED